MIRAEHVSKSFGAKRALSDVSLEVVDGSITGFVGPNGAGKTTLMRVIAGLTEPDAGSATVDGQPFAHSRRPAETLGVCLSTDTLPPKMTGRGLLLYECRVLGLDRDRVAANLELVGLADAANKRIGAYSSGMKQRLGVAMAFLANPRNLILDEPTNGLDITGVRWLRDFIQAKAADGAAILLSSHILSELALVADHVVMISNGSIIAEGTVESLSTEKTGGSYVESPSLDTLLAALGHQQIAATREGAGALVDADALQVSQVALQAGLLLSHLSAHRQSLEDIYINTAAGQGDNHE